MAPVEPPQPPEVVAVDVVYGIGPRQVDATTVTVPAGSVVLDAVRAAGVLERHGLLVEALLLGVWNRTAAASTPLRAGDRVEVYRPLLVDPKEARRQRHARQMPARPLRRERESGPD